MDTAHEVRNTEMEDLPFIYDLFEQSIIYQEKKGYPVWRHYDRDALHKDSKIMKQDKICVDFAIARVFSVAYNDRIIWRALDKGDSMYLHRIVINPRFKCQKRFGHVVAWAIRHCQEKGLPSIR